MLTIQALGFHLCFPLLCQEQQHDRHVRRNVTAAGQYTGTSLNFQKHSAEGVLAVGPVVT